MTATATASSSDSGGSPARVSHFLLQRLHSLTGLIFGGYIVVHLLINATLIEGVRAGNRDTVFQLQVNKIHSIPFLVGVEWALIYLPILFHGLYGTHIALSGRPNPLRYSYGQNWLYLLQRISAVIVALFIAFHLLAMKGLFAGDMGRAMTFHVDNATQSMVNHIHAAVWVGCVVYPIGILASCFHLANGLRTAAMTWGLTVSKAAQRRWALVCAGLFVLAFGLGTAALVAAMGQSAMAGR